MKLGSAYRNQGEYSAALPLLQQAVHADPYFILAWLELAKVQEEVRLYGKGEFESTGI